MEVFGSEPLYTTLEIGKIEEAAIRSHQHTGSSLMLSAARASFETLSKVWPTNRKIQVFCGTGKNGGDGYLLAGLALSRGWQVVVWQLGDLSRIKGETAIAREHALLEGIAEQEYQSGSLHPEGVIVDAMIGTGLKTQLRPEYQNAVCDINRSGLPVLAIDLPTGLNADTGEVVGDAIRANHTITFIEKKRGFFTASGPDFVGDLKLNTLDLRPSGYGNIVPNSYRLDLDALLLECSPRKYESHKGTFGSVLIVGGNYNMGGAVALAGEAALRTGAGLVRVLTRKEHITFLLTRTPELMVFEAESENQFESIIYESDVVLIGPGLGSDSWAEQLLDAGLKSSAAIVLDADALNLLTNKKITSLRSKCIISTPHPGEAARLLSCPSAEVQKDRFKAAESIQEILGGIVVLKGNGTLIFDGQNFFLCGYGNPGMATAGMGDVLGGVVASFLAQGLEAKLACSLAVSLHAAAADKIRPEGMRGMIASDLMVPMREFLG